MVAKFFFQLFLFRMRPTECGNIQLIFGPMFSGKSTELMRRVNRYQIAGKKCLLIKWKKVRIKGRLPSSTIPETITSCRIYIILRIKPAGDPTTNLDDIFRMIDMRIKNVPVTTEESLQLLKQKGSCH